MRRHLCIALLLIPSLVRAESFIAPAEIQPGMKGYGLTVFHGTTIERFDVEALGVMPFADLDDSWIMFQVTSGPVFERHSGIVAGMSGSPVYFDGRLAGAVAFGFPFSKEPIGFLQPIGSMMRALNVAGGRTAPAPKVAQTRPLARPVTVEGTTFDRVRLSGFALPPGYRSAPGELAVEPLATPVCVSGLGLSGVESLRELLAPYHFEVLATPGGRSEDGGTLEPGAPLGVCLATGDVQAVATGTVTYRDGDRVLGFGHPMFQRNQVAMPLCGASILDFFNGYERSFKLAAGGPVRGTLQADTRWGVAGALGAAPAMVPVVLKMRDADSGWSKTVNFQVIDDPELTPGLALNFVRELVAGELGMQSKVTFTSRTTVDLAGQEPLVRHQSGFIPAGPPLAVLGDLLNAAQLVAASPFDELRIKGIDMEVALRHEDRTATISRALFDQPQCKPGESLHLTLELRRHSDGSLSRHSVTIPVPANTPPGRYRLGVIGGPLTMNLEGQLGILPTPPQTTRQLLERIKELDTDDWSLVTELALPSFDDAVRGERLPDPPANVDALLAHGGTVDTARMRASLKQVEPLDLLITNGLLAEAMVLDPLTGEPPVGNPGGPPPNAGRPDQAPQAASILPGLEPATLPAPLDFCWQPPLWLDAANGQARSVLDLDPTPPARRRARPDGTAAAAGGSAPPRPAAPKPPEPAPAATGAPGHGPRTWTVASAKDWAGGYGDGVTLTADGRLALSAGEEVLGTADEPHLWGLDVDKAGTAWLASSNGGELLKVSGGKTTVAWHGDAPLVTAVQATPDGVVFASAPDGTLRRLGADGKAVELGATRATYVWQMQSSVKGGVLAVTGRPGRLLRIHGDKVETLAEPGVEHLLCLAEAPDGAVYCGGGHPSGLWQWKDGVTRLVAGTTEPVTAVALGADGVIYFAAGSTLSRLDAAGRRRTLAPLDNARILALHYTPQGLLATTGLRADGHSVLWLVDERHDQAGALFDVKAAGITALRADGDRGLLATTDAPARLYRLKLPCGAKGSYESTILDAGARAVWGTFEAGIGLGSSGDVGREVRVGDSPRPGADWTDWMPVAERVQAPPARYLQYRLRLTGDDGRTPLVEYTRLTYAPLSGGPKVQLDAPALGTAWHGKQDIRWKTTDADNDTLLASVWLRAEGERAWRRLAENLTTPSYSLDTVALKLRDGRYRVRVVVDDSASNPTGARQDEATSSAFVVDNTPPEVALTAEPSIADGVLRADGLASDNMSVAAVEWRLDGGPWRGAKALNGLFGTAHEVFSLQTQVAGGKHVLEIRARDAAGNETLRKWDVAAEGAKAVKAPK
jgi:hypothetical protein